MSVVTWQRSIEQIVLSTIREKPRVLGMASLRRGAGVSLVCQHLAKTIATSESKTLLLDMCELRAGKPDPVDPIAASECFVATEEGYDLFRARTIAERKELFGSLRNLREFLGGALQGYGSIIVDMPPLFDDADTGINAISAAACCDKVLLLCVIGRDTRGDLVEAVARLHGAGVSLSGIVANELLNFAPPAPRRGSVGGQGVSVAASR